MEYKKGERVRHPTMISWGLGEVLADSNSNDVKKFFVGAGERTIALQYVQPQKVSVEDSAHPVLDNVMV